MSLLSPLQQRPVDILPKQSVIRDFCIVQYNLHWNLLTVEFSVSFCMLSPISMATGVQLCGLTGVDQSATLRGTWKPCALQPGTSTRCIIDGPICATILAWDIMHRTDWPWVVKSWAKDPLTEAQWPLLSWNKQQEVVFFNRTIIQVQLLRWSQWSRFSRHPTVTRIPTLTKKMDLQRRAPGLDPNITEPLQSFHCPMKERH